MTVAETATASPSRQINGALIALLLIALSQILFWLTLTYLERQSQPASLSTVQSVSLILSNADGGFDSDTRAVTATRSDWPYYLYVDPELRPKAKFQLVFDAPNHSEPLALYLNYTNTLGDVRLNGGLLKGRLGDSMWVALDVFAPSLIPLPEESLRPRGNVIEIEMIGAGRKLLAPFAIDRADALRVPFQWGSFIATALPLASIAIMMFTIVLCLVTRWPKQDEHWIQAFVALIAAWAVYNLLSLGLLSSLMPDSLFWRHAVHWFVLYAFLFVFVRFVLRWTSAPRWATWAAGFAFAAIYIAAVSMHAFSDIFDPLTGRRVSQEWRKILEHVATIGAGLLMISLLLRDVARRRDRLLETFLFLIGVTGMTVDAIDDRFSLLAPFQSDLPLTFSIGPACGLLMALGMCAALARHSAEARHVVVNANAELAAKLVAKEKELALGYAQRNRILQRAVVLEERQRIVRDMHDGIGGQLLGLKVQVRAGQIDAKTVEAALNDSITDMRLIVDSLDMADEPLSVALRSFENRIRDQIEAAGCACIIRHNLSGANAHYGPRTTLQVLRVLQEAVTNALRHAAASTIRIESNTAPDGGACIAIIDDGNGIASDAQPGRGLSNIQFRAQSIAAKLDIITSAGGTEVRLTLAPGATAETPA